MKVSRVILGAACIATAAAWTVTREAPVPDSKSEVMKVLAVFGCEIKDGKITERSSTAAGSLMKEYYFSVVGDGNAYVSSNESHGNFTISLQRRGTRNRGIGRTGAKKWANESKARQYALSKLKELAGTQKGALVRFKYSLDHRDNNDRFVPGLLDAHFEFTFSGHPMIDRYCGYMLKLDPQDGHLVKFRKGPRPPLFAPPGTPGSESAARSRAQARYDKADIAAMSAKLGWALPPGSDQAVLTYSLRHVPPVDATVFFVEAKSNGRIWDIGP